jgi:nucleoside-triphosphatase
VKILAITGPLDSGKTRKARELLGEYRSRGLKVGGILSLPEYSGDRKTGYFALDIDSGKSELLLSESFSGPGFSRNRFRFSRAGFDFASSALSRAAFEGADAIIIDEIGRIELEGEGFASVLRSLLASYEGELILVVRDAFLEEIRRAFGLPADMRILKA